ncbi:MAG: ATP-binding cassette domain-containing protein [Propionibacteriaceae bacterium]|nr:ATP-binding cassette domain-containing protein [Propionibacteriaceae bacterium]
MGTSLARLSGVDVSHGRRRVLKDVDLELVRGTQLAVLGRSGAGKSTLVRLLSRELQATEGTIEFARDHLRDGLVRQEPLLFGWLTIAENVAIGQRFHANAENPGLVTELLSLLGIADVADSFPDQVSGGQAQRAAFARALAISPDLLLLDEPFSALDPATRTELQQWLRRILTHRALTSVLVTHDLDEALILADRIVLIEDGRITRRWDNPHPPTSQAAAQSHPLRAELRAAFDTTWEPGDEEFSGATWHRVEVSHV